MELEKTKVSLKEAKMPENKSVDNIALPLTYDQKNRIMELVLAHEDNRTREYDLKTYSLVVEAITNQYQGS